MTKPDSRPAPENDDIFHTNTELPRERFERLLTEEIGRNLSRYIAKFVIDQELTKELYQDAVGQAFLKLDTINDEERFSGWIIRIARNIVNKFFRDRKRERQQFAPIMNLDEYLPELASDLLNPAEQAENEQSLKQAISEALLSLPPKARFALIANCVDETPLSEIAETLQMSYSKTKRMLTATKATLRERLKDMLVVYVTTELYQGDTKAWADEVIQKLCDVPVEVPVVAATTTATGVSGLFAKGKYHLFSFVSFVFLVFACILSFLLGGLAVGKRLLLDAPTLRARRWLVRKFLVWHIGLLTAPFIFLTAALILVVGLGFSEPFFRQYVIVPEIILLLCGSVSYLTWGVSAYFVQRKLPENDSCDGGYPALHRFVQTGLRLCTVMIVACFVIFCWLIAGPNLRFLLAPSINQEKFITVSMSLFLAAIILFGIHALYRLLFDQFLKIANDPSSLLKSGPPMDETTRGKWRDESALVVPFALIPTWYYANHLLNVTTRPFEAFLEILRKIVPVEFSCFGCHRFYCC